jgi:arylsulfatase A-like enzyme
MKYKLLIIISLITFVEKLCAQKKPNVIYILVDDLGYGDLGCFGSSIIKTPHIDNMAKNGVKFTNHYSTSVCAPSRAALMTGRDMGHCEIRGNVQNPENGNIGQLPLSDTVKTVANLFKENGYATALIGKWGLGNFGTTGDPNKKGFDLAYGYSDQVLAHNSFPEYLLRNGKKENLKNKVKYLDTTEWHRGVASISTEKVEFSQDLFTKEALNFIESNSKKPFFLYLTYTIPHVNDEAPPSEMIEVPNTGIYASQPWSNEQKCYAAAISYLDNDIHKIMLQLEKLGIEKNTLVIFTSDNGPKKSDIFNSNAGMKGVKRDLYEGGIKVPFVAQWKGKIKPQSSVDEQYALWDFMPTAADLLGVQSPKTDGISYLNALLGKKQKNREYLYFEIHDAGKKQALIWGNYKFVRYNIKVAQALPPLEMYNLSNDPAEQKNIANQNPEKVKRAEEIMKKSRILNNNFSF